MKRIVARDPFNKIEYEISDFIQWKGNIGAGDLMMGLNACHMIAHMLKSPVYMDVHWPHGEDYLFHFEDPETIIERFDYLHSCFYKNETVIVNHIFNSDDEDIVEFRWRGFQRIRKPRGAPFNGINNWVFRDELFRPEIENKVVIWKPFNNATPSQRWKLSFGRKDWYKIENHYLKKKHGYDVFELDYRTPIREVVYHISTCKFVVCYEGMWGYVARNFMKPAVVFGNNSIVKVHNPQAIIFAKPIGYEKLFKDKDNLERKLEQKAREYRKKVRRVLTDEY